jgi:mono/diheme cytochrome c family protein
MRGGLLLALVVSGLLCAGRANGADTKPGRAAYLKYCSACHGTNGQGDGVVSGAMRPKPTDLTQLKKMNGGKFPSMRVRDIIDGRKPIPAHGSSEMPVWGELFGEQKAAAQPNAHIRAQVQLITDYLASIQAP